MGTFQNLSKQFHHPLPTLPLTYKILVKQKGEKFILPQPVENCGEGLGVHVQVVHVVVGGVDLLLSSHHQLVIRGAALKHPGQLRLRTLPD